jgi:hypothetical protein
MVRVREEDPKRQAMIAVCTAWWDKFKGDEKTATAIVQEAFAPTTGDDGGPPPDPSKPRPRRLQDALSAVTNGKLNAPNFGKWLGGNKDRPVGGYVIRVRTLQGNSMWKLEKV